MALADTAARLQNDALRQIAVQRAEEAATTAKLTAARDQVAALQVQMQAALAAATAAAEQAAAAKATLDSLAAQQRAEVAAVAAQKAAEKARLRLAAGPVQPSGGKVLAALARRQHGGIYRRPGGFLSYPAIGPAVLAVRHAVPPDPALLADARRPWTSAIACGTPVHAAAAGRVISAGWAGGYGNRVIIDHGAGQRHATWRRRYNHLSRIVVHGGHVVARPADRLLRAPPACRPAATCTSRSAINGTPVNPQALALSGRPAAAASAQLGASTAARAGSVRGDTEGRSGRGQGAGPQARRQQPQGAARLPHRGRLRGRAWC